MQENNPNQPDVKNLLEENLKLTREIHEMSRKIKNYVTFQKILSIFYLLIFVIPLILSIIYIPIFIRDYLTPYQELLENSGNTMNLNREPGIGDILNQAQKIIDDNK